MNLLLAWRPDMALGGAYDETLERGDPTHAPRSSTPEGPWRSFSAREAPPRVYVPLNKLLFVPYAAETGDAVKPPLPSSHLLPLLRFLCVLCSPSLFFLRTGRGTDRRAPLIAIPLSTRRDGAIFERARDGKGEAHQKQCFPVQQASRKPH